MADDTKDDYAKSITAQLTGKESAPAKPEAEPEPKDTPPRGDDGKFVSKKQATPEAEKPDDAELKIDDEAEPDDEPDKRGAGKKIEQLNYEVKNLAKQLNTVLEAIKAQGTATPKQVEKVAEIAEEIDELKDRDDLEEATVGDLRKLAKKAKADPALKSEVDELRRELAEQKRENAAVKAERAFDRQYPELAGQYEKLVGKAWAEADKRMPDTPDDDPRKIGRVQAYLELLADNANKARKTPSAKPEPKPSPKPDTSTKGAQIAGKSAARDSETQVDPDAKFHEYAKGIAAQLAT